MWQRSCTTGVLNIRFSDCVEDLWLVTFQHLTDISTSKYQHGRPGDRSEALVMPTPLVVDEVVLSFFYCFQTRNVGDRYTVPHGNCLSRAALSLGGWGVYQTGQGHSREPD